MRRSRPTDAADPAERSGGFTIVELMITSTLLMIVLMVIYGAFDQVVKSQAYEADRSESLDGMRITLNRMTRELRQASSVDETASTSSNLVFDTYGRTGPRHVVYSVSGTSLTRKVGNGNAVTVQKSLDSATLFTYVDAPPVPGAQWVQINLRVRPPRTPDTVLILDSEVNLRNRTGADA